jgi:regulator of sigma E protease
MSHSGRAGVARAAVGNGWKFGDAALSVLVSILGLALLIVIHEAGHFFTALGVGMRPRKFYIGFPPAVAKKVRGGVEYGIGAIPLGGYVKIPGMHRPAASDVDAYLGAALYEAPALVGPAERLKRCLDTNELETARREALPELDQAVRASELSPGAHRSAERGLGEIGDALSPEAYWRQRTWKRVVVIFAGPGANLLFAIAVLAVVYMLGLPVDATRKVDTVIPDTPAAAAGLRSGDEIVAINGKPVRSYDDVSRTIRASGGKPIVVLVNRDGRRLGLGPRPTELRQGHYSFGFYVKLRYKHYSPPGALAKAVEETGHVTKEIGASLGRIVTGSGRKDVSSPVGIVSESSKAAKVDYRYYLGILALISLSLALLNLLPLLPLDGGHIAFSIIEGIRGRAVGRVVYERVSAIGIALVLLLFVLGLSNDIDRLRGG